MKAKARAQQSMRLSWTTVIIIAAIVVFAGLCLLSLLLQLLSYPPADTTRWLAYCGIGAAVIVVMVVILHGIHETRATRRVVAEALEGRSPMTDEEFGSRFYQPAIAPVAARLRHLLADNLECDLAGMIPPDCFEEWLELFPGPDSAADSFFEAVAIEFHLTRDCPWPERFGSFDSLVRFVAEHADAAKAK